MNYESGTTLDFFREIVEKENALCEKCNNKYTIEKVNTQYTEEGRLFIITDYKCEMCNNKDRIIYE